jgi:N-acetylmuramoyl-L-alanine amidase
MISVSQSNLNISKCPPRRLIWAITCLLVLMTNLGRQAHGVLPAKEWSRRKVIVLDPGHGGTDTGAVGPSGLTEKAVTLSLAKKIKDRLSGTCNVYLTRDDDHGVDIERRTEFANHLHADLFVSIHAGGDFGQTGSGVVVVYQGLPAGIGSTASQQGRNAWIEREQRASWTGLWTKHAAENRVLAETMYQYIGRKDSSEDKGVRQAPVLVLEGADMPALLVEIGCLTHPGEEAFLGRPEGISSLSEAISKGIEAFFHGSP